MSGCVVIFDCSSGWTRHGTVLREVAAAVRVFVCALVCANRANRVALVAAQGRHSRLAFVESESDEYRKDANAVAEEVERAVLQSVSSAEHVSAAAGMGGALALALCYAHKLRLARPQLAPTRFLVVSCSPDEPQSYVSMMNSLFACQKDGVVLDVLAVCSESSYLNQGTSLTGGIFVSAKERFLPLLLGLFFAEKNTRKEIVMPRQPLVDSRGACFCHGKACEMGFVCSVCMAIFCSFVPVCSMCGSKFEFGPLPALK